MIYRLFDIFSLVVRTTRLSPSLMISSGHKTIESGTLGEGYPNNYRSHFFLGLLEIDE